MPPAVLASNPVSVPVEEYGNRSLRIVVVGAVIRGSRTVQRIRAARDLGHRVDVIATNRPDQDYETLPSFEERLRHRLRLPADPEGANDGLIAAAGDGACDLVWLENAALIRARTLKRIKRNTPETRLVWYSEDDMMSRRHGSVWLDRCLPLFDLWLTTKSFNAAPNEMPSRGVRKALFVNNSYDPHTHRPMELSQADKDRFGAEICFVGTFEAPRAESLLHLARNGVEARIWGNGWSRMKNRHPLLRIEGEPIYDDDYARVLNASKINLGFLRKANRDLQTTRSVEIPACGAFMLHERNDEICSLFSDDREAAYFGDNDELLEQCRRWLADDERRTRVAIAGHKKAVSGGFGHHDLLRRSIDAAMNTPVAPAQRP